MVVSGARLWLCHLLLNPSVSEGQAVGIELAQSKGGRKGGGAKSASLREWIR